MNENAPAISTALDLPSFNWIVCPADPRWLAVFRRFSAELTPAGCVMPVIPADPDTILDVLAVQNAGILFWAINGENFADLCDRICLVATRFPDVLQLAASGTLNDADTTAVREMGVGLTVGRPEEVPKLAHLVDVYFARLA